jgi:hypothetical protein
MGAIKEFLRDCYQRLTSFSVFAHPIADGAEKDSTSPLPKTTVGCVYFAGTTRNQVSKPNKMRVPTSENRACRG